MRRGPVRLCLLLRHQGVQPGGWGPLQRPGHLADRRQEKQPVHLGRVHPQPGYPGCVLLSHDAHRAAQLAAAGRRADLVPAEVLVWSQGRGGALLGEGYRNMGSASLSLGFDVEGVESPDS